MQRLRHGRTTTRGFGRAQSATALVLTAVVAASSAVVAAPGAARAAGNIAINADAVAVDQPAVTLTFASQGSGATLLRIANNLELVDGVLVGTERPWTSSVTWTLDATGDDGERTVYAQWSPGDGTWSSVMSDSIWLDRVAPTGTIVINGGDQFLGDPWAWRGSAYEFTDATLSLDVSDVGPSAPPAAWALSRDGVTWSQLAFTGAGYGPYTHVYDVHGRAIDEGPKPVWVKWRDAAGNWSAPVSDSIHLRYHWAGQVVVNDDIGYTNSFTVSVKAPVDAMPPEGVRYLYLATDLIECDAPPKGAGCPVKRFAWQPGMIVQWDMNDPAYGGSPRLGGGRRVLAWVESTTGRTARLEQGMFIVDVQPPVTGPPRPTVTFNSTVSTGSGSNVTADIRWSTSGTGSPVAANQLQQTTNASAWGYVSLATPQATSAPRALTPGSAYRFRTRNQDRAGNWGSWTYGTTFGVAPTQQSSTAVRYAGTWTTWARPDAWGGSLRYTRSKGASATLTFRGRGIAIIGPRSGNGGEMDVYIDGRLANTAYQRSNVLQPRRVVFTTSWSTSGTHTIKIVKKYDNRDYPIYLDGFLVLK